MRPDFFGGMLKRAMAQGLVPEAAVKEKATRVVYSLAAVGALDGPAPTGTVKTNVTSAAHFKLARQLAGATAILLKNKGQVLPLAPETTRIALIGGAGFQNCDPETTAAGASQCAIYGGAGSGKVVPLNPVSLLEGILVRAHVLEQ